MKENIDTAAAAAAVAKAAPPLTVTGMHIAGYPLSDWLLLLTILYTLLQIVVLARRMMFKPRANDPECDGFPVAVERKGSRK